MNFTQGHARIDRAACSDGSDDDAGTAPLSMMRPGRYRKRPVTVDAMRWAGDLAAVVDFAGDRVRRDPVGGDDLIVASLEGDVRCPPGHWVVRGVRGEVYVCDPAIFAETHESTMETNDAD